MDDDPTRNYRTVLVEKPSEGIAVGATISFQPFPIITENYTRVDNLGDWRETRGIICAFYVGQREHAEIHGSAVIVAPGVALCATHVIEKYAELFKELKAYALLHCFTPEGLQLWRVVEAVFGPSSDIAILTLQAGSAIPTSGEYLLPIITTRIPQIGERLTCIGYRSSEILFSSTDGVPDGVIGGKLVAATGQVTDLFLRGRPGMPGSTLIADFPSWGGMSGGPVFDQSGRLVGLLSASFELLDSDEPSPSTVSLIWQVLGAFYRGGWPPLEQTEGRHSLYDLAVMAKPLCYVERVDRILIVNDPASGQPVTVLKIADTSSATDSV